MRRQHVVGVQRRRGVDGATTTAADGRVRGGGRPVLVGDVAGARRRPDGGGVRQQRHLLRVVVVVVVSEGVFLQRAEPYRLLLAARSDGRAGRHRRRQSPAEPQRQRVRVVDAAPRQLLRTSRARTPLP